MVGDGRHGDGRYLDPRLAGTTGEAADVAVEHPAEAWPVPPEARREGPVPETVAGSDTYYDLPVIKTPPWKWYVPGYFYAGGLAGAAATVGAFAPRRLARRLHRIALGAEVIGAGLLIADLGRPARFHHMLRVFRPTSPMNLGTWILGATGGTGVLAMLGVPAAGIANAVTGAMLSTYTGVLIGNTAVPLWNVTRRHLPVWFATSSAASLGSLLELTERRPLRAYSVMSKAAELIAATAVERAAGRAGVAAPLHEGRSGRMWKASKWLGVASLAATVVRRPRLAGVLGTAATVLARFAIVEAGKASAADPRQTFDLQRGRTGSGSLA